MSTLTVVDEQGGTQLGIITRTPSGAIETSGIGAAIFEQIKDGKGWNEWKTFEELASGGWSNGYVTVKPA